MRISLILDQLALRSLVVAAAIVGLTACRTPGSSGGSTTLGDRPVPTIVQLSGADVTGLSGVANNARDKASGLVDLREDYQDAISDGSLPLDQKENAVAAFFNAVDRLAGDAQRLVGLLTQRLGDPKVMAGVTSYAEIPGAEVDGLATSLEALSSPDGALPKLRLAATRYQMRVMRSLQPNAQPDPQLQTSIPAARREMRDLITTVKTQIDSVATTLGAWAAKVQDHTPQVLPPPIPAGPTLVSREYYCKAVDPSFPSLDNDLMIRTRWSDNDMKNQAIERFRRQTTCNALVAIFKTKCVGTSSCSFTTCIPLDPSFESLDNNFLQYTVDAGQGAANSRKVFLAKRRTQCDFMQTTVTTKCPNIAGCDQRFCLAVDPSFESLDTIHYRLQTGGDGYLALQSQETFSRRPQCLQAIGQ